MRPNGLADMEASRSFFLKDKSKIAPVEVKQSYNSYKIGANYFISVYSVVFGERNALCCREVS